MLIDSSFNTGFHTANYELMYYFPPVHLIEFVLGNLLGILYLNQNNAAKNYDLLVLFFGISIVLVSVFVTNVSFQNGLLAPIILPFIYFLAKNNGFISKLFDRKKWVFLGEISFGIYILQAPVFIAVSEIFEIFGWQNNLLRFCISLAILLLLSSFTYKKVELPLVRYFKS